MQQSRLSGPELKHKDRGTNRMIPGFWPQISGLKQWLWAWDWLSGRAFSSMQSPWLNPQGHSKKFNHLWGTKTDNDFFVAAVAIFNCSW